jgi:hypothetical protein
MSECLTDGGPLTNSTKRPFGALRSTGARTLCALLVDAGADVQGLVEATSPIVAAARCGNNGALRMLPEAGSQRGALHVVTLVRRGLVFTDAFARSNAYTTLTREPLAPVTGDPAARWSGARWKRFFASTSLSA